MGSISDEQSKTLTWRVKSIKIFLKAFARYNELISPYATQENTALFQEFQEAQHFIDYLNEKISSIEEEDYKHADFTFSGKSWGKILDVLWKYYSWKKQLLAEKERKISIKAALEGDQRHLDEINEILKNDCWELFTRHAILVDSFYTSAPTPETNDPILQQVFNVETLNGILAGTNSGTITQNNESKQVLNAIDKLSEILKEEKISNQHTAEAFVNLQKLQGEMLKPFPDKNILKQASDGLQVLANFTQLGSFVISIAPHLHTIQQFVTNLV
jgi:hypothetical protein